MGTKRIRIALDGMGGDFAPGEVVRGAVEAVRGGDLEVTLVGPEDRLWAELADHQVDDLPISVLHTDEFIVDGESPAMALRTKPRASMLLCAQLAQRGEADAAVSLGHTGACMIAAHWTFGSLPGVRRPVVGGPVLPFAWDTLVFDLGANVDCKPEQFLQFAAVGVAYARRMMGVPNPTVGLLSNGREPGKGSEQTKAAYELLENGPFDFRGYVEGWDLTQGLVNVALCDGFVGNVMTKYAEGLGAALAQWLTQQLDGQLPEPRIEELVRTLRGMMEVEQQLGGAPLLGVDGLMVVGHGRSRAPAVVRVIDVARRAAESQLIAGLRAELSEVASAISAAAD